MKHLITATASLTSLMAITALGQENPSAYHQTNANTNASSQHRVTGAMRPADQLHGAARASELLGMTVNNDRDEKLGKVEDLALDLESGRVLQVILSTGGFLGIGDALTGVPPGALRHDVAQKVLHLTADKERLMTAPKFEMEKWAECCSSNHLSTTYRHFGRESDLTFVDHQQRTTHPDQTRNWVSGQKERQDYQTSVIPADRLPRAGKASQLIGTTVHNLQDEKLGKLEDVLVDLGSGRLVAAVISSGGFLGMGNELSAVPPGALKLSSDGASIRLDASKAMLAAAPHFKSDQWPDFTESSYTEVVYRAYRQEPYFGSRETSKADNTARNVADRDGRTLTAADQGNSATDLDITSRIRQGIMDGKNMSVNAQNVKIITTRGQVTLRGPVNSLEEKRALGDIALSVASLGNVDNQLEVK
ncbi:MAG: PRC-barrel domain-containing protein [Verrucomicrobiales bacterium]|nr:PRC-barrel domain-containing protein [Verrucomicrobiales bacterium]